MSSALDQIAAWIGQRPDRLACYAFHAAIMMERDALPYRATFDRIVASAVDAGLAEGRARKLVYRGFAYAAAGFREPPNELIELQDED